ncbi:MAG TPA: exopolyphosphatase [bacterium]|nr:exopolyphosphatase [bacterium]
MRLLTRSDFDGLGCAVLLREAGIIDDIKFVHPKDIQDGKVDVSTDDVLANVPYVKGCGIWFDHHSSERERKEYGSFEGASDPSALSAARVIFNYYGGEEKFPGRHFRDLLHAVDKSDAALFAKDDILEPEGWALLSFIMDPRTGLGRYKDYRISNYQLMMDMIDYCRAKSIDEILEIDDVKERVVRYFEQDKLFRNMIRMNSAVNGNLVVLDLRNQDEIYTGNRFMIYCLYPDQNISMQIMWGFQRQNIVITCGHSIINKTSRTDVGSLMLKYGGGGHRGVGTCQVQVKESDSIIRDIIRQINTDG